MHSPSRAVGTKPGPSLDVPASAAMCDRYRAPGRPSRGRRRAGQTTARRALHVASAQPSALLRSRRKASAHQALGKHDMKPIVNREIERLADMRATPCSR
eukprot:5332068-Pleurochrysis_carterae.AAC.1